MNGRGNALLTVMIVTVLFALISSALYRNARAHRKQAQAQSNYAVASDRAEAAIAAARIWIDSLNDPPELDAAFVSGCNRCYKQISNQKEEQLSSVSFDQFYRIDENGDGSVDASDAGGYLLIPLGVSAAGNCISNDGYSNSCWRTHTYLVLARAKTGIKTEVQRKQEFSRQFYY